MDVHEIFRAIIDDVVSQTVAQTLAQVEQDRARLDGRLAFTEAEAASKLGIPRHSLRDARLRGEIVASRIGKRILYQRDELLRLLDSNRLI